MCLWPHSPLLLELSKIQVCVPEHCPSQLGSVIQDSQRKSLTHTQGTQDAPRVLPTMRKHRVGGQLGHPITEREGYMEKVP